MEKLNGQSMNLTENNIYNLKQLFPEVFTEGKIDFDKLRLVLGDNIEENDERYQFTWNGKSEAIKNAQTPSMGTLRPDKESSKNWDNTENLYIEGDNLEVLKLLQKSYFGKIKMIYIDPPYNTGKDFVYKDNFRDSIGNYKEVTNQTTKANAETSGRYHTDWLNMMYPRLKLARNLLREDGVIFISIDDNEVSNLRKICDEIFGEDNFIANIGLEITKTQGMKVKAAKEGSVVKNYEYILCFAKSNLNKNIVTNILYDSNDGYDTHFSYYLDTSNNNFRLEKLTDILEKNKDIYNEFYKIGLLKNNKISINSIEKAILISEKVKQFIYNDYSKNIYQEMACNIKIEDNINEQLDQGKIVKYNGYILTKSSGGKLRQLSSLYETLNFSDEYKSEYGRVTIRGDLWKGFYSDMMNVAKEGNIEYKNGKKPLRLVKQLIKWIGVNDNDIVLDFFSGSATTAHSVIQSNLEEDKQIKYILIQIPQIIDKKNDDYNGQFENICEIGKERIRRAGDKIVSETGKSDLDIGFKVFKLDDSNIKEWSPKYDELEATLDEMTDNLKSGRTKEDLLFEILIKMGIELTAPIEEINVGDKKIYNIGMGSLVICLEDEITEEIIKEIPKYKSFFVDMKVVFKETGFRTDSQKMNAMQNLKQFGITDVRSV